MVNKVKQVVGYGILNFILFAIISLIFSGKSTSEWHSMVIVLLLTLLASALLYRNHPMAIYLMALEMLFVGITVVTAIIQLSQGKLALSGLMLGVSWVIVLVNLAVFVLWIKTSIQYRRAAGVYFRK